MGRRLRLVVMVSMGVVVPGLLGLQGPLVALASSGDEHHQAGAIYVSPQGSPAHSAHSGRSCATARFTSINAAVGAARTGGTVVVCKGTYFEDVLINKALTLMGRHATIDATGLENGVQVVASHVGVNGFTLRNANGEGVLVGIDSFADISLLPPSGPVLSHVTIQDNNVINNNKGFNGTEQGNCKYGFDCGGGIHFNVTTHSIMRGNHVTGNVDGVLLTDDYGPNSYNLVEDNVVSYNLHECGITLPSHSQTAVSFDPNTFAVTGRNPSLGGVFNNVIRDNVADGNGTDQAPAEFGGGGSGSGIGLFGSGPGSAVYNNLVEDNEASGNGLAGIAIHAHHPGGEDMNGNRLIGNNIGTNNLFGDGFDGPPGPMDFMTTGIAVFSVPVATMTITDNTIHDNTIGIWLSNTVTARGLDENKFRHVIHHVVRG